MPLGAPFQTVPKSGWRPRSMPILAINAVEFGSTGAAEMSVFHALSGGKKRNNRSCARADGHCANRITRGTAAAPARKERRRTLRSNGLQKRTALGKGPGPSAARLLSAIRVCIAHDGYAQCCSAPTTSTLASLRSRYMCIATYCPRQLARSVVATHHSLSFELETRQTPGRHELARHAQQQALVQPTADS